jgi:hypothetical protein
MRLLPAFGITCFSLFTMKQVITVFLVSNSLFLATTTQAQATFSIGPQVGLNVSAVRLLNNSTLLTDIRYRTGYEAGLVGNIGFKHLAVQPSILFSQKGVRTYGAYNIPGQGISTNTYTLRLNYVTVPVKVAYTPRPNGQGFQVFAGPYLGILVGGNFQQHSTYGDPTLPQLDYDGPVKAGQQQPTSRTFYSKRIDAGLQAGIGYRLGGFLVHADYSLGLRNLGLDKNTSGSSLIVGPDYGNYAFQASIAYLFCSKS